MTISDFPKFFAAVNGGREPFDWQVRLAAEVAETGWPALLNVPTGAGKTSLVDIAVFTLALQSGRPPLHRTAPLRTFFVIDRRVVVDQAFRRARRLEDATSNPADSIVAEVSQRLSSYGGDKPLLAAELRGGMYREHTWADAPNQPLVCVSTVDQIGSRLLFRGYGVNGRQRPIQAAFAALDSLIILDEAHLSQPFAETVSACRRWMDIEGKTIAPAVRLVQMSATLAPNTDTFHLTPAERNEERLAPRLKAAKVATLTETGHLEADAAAAALDMLGRLRTVAVVVNRVASARSIFERLRKSAGEAEVILLTGRIREWDRANLLRAYEDRLSPDRVRDDENRLCVVATQTIEVGADMDFDGLVTEAAALDALRQRLGRLDRLGASKNTEVVILRRAVEADVEQLDPIYGEALDQTWKWLISRAGKLKRLDCGTNALDAQLRRHPPKRSLYADPEQGPLLLPSHLDALVQTDPEPAPDPQVSVFLHGPSALEAADVNVVWRADLDSMDPSYWPATITLAPPVMGEAVPVPIYAVRRWLEGHPAEAIADVEGIPATSNRTQGGRIARAALIWNGPDDIRVVESGRDVVPGCTVIVPSSEGGCDEYGWNPEQTAPVRDIAEFCHNRDLRRRPRLRLHSNVLACLSWPTPDSPVIRNARKLLEEYLAGQREETGTNVGISAILTAVKTLVPDGSDLARTVEAILAAPERSEVDFYSDFSGVVVTAPSSEDPRDDSDESLFSLAITLEEHTAHVRAVTAMFVKQLGLNASFVSDLMVAAEAHDLGKADERFQTMLHGGQERQADEPLLAKSEPRTASARRRAASAAGWPTGARHEFVSAALLSHSELARARAADWDLVMHLVGAHHGLGRPFAPMVRDAQPIQVRVTFGSESLDASSDHEFYRLGSGWVDQFWRLIGRYGYWGLSFLEAVLRRADCVASRREEEGLFND